MRRPLNWFVVCISLLVLFANRVLVTPELPPPALAVMPAGVSGSPFAYVREDGSQVAVLLARPDVDPPRSFEDLHALQFEAASPVSAEPAAAVYTWSSPVDGGAF